MLHFLHYSGLLLFFFSGLRHNKNMNETNTSNQMSEVATSTWMHQQEKHVVDSITTRCYLQHIVRRCNMMLTVKQVAETGLSYCATMNQQQEGKYMFAVQYCMQTRFVADGLNMQNHQYSLLNYLLSLWAPVSLSESKRLKSAKH